LERMYDLNEIM